GRLLQWTQAIFQHLFTRIPSKLFHSPRLAFEFIHFCKDSLPLFGRNHGFLRLSFPNLCKSCSASLGQWGAGGPGGTDTLRPGCTLTCPPGSPLTLLSLQFLVWNNPPLTLEFVVLLPELADSGIGCGDAARAAGPAGHDRGHGPMTQAGPTPPAAIAFGQLCLGVPVLPCGAHPAPGLLGCDQALGRGLAARLHSLSHYDPQYADGAVANQLALLLLERSDSLYQVPQYDAQVHRVLSSQFLALCGQQPSLVVELAKELLDFVGSASGHLSTGLMRTSVINMFFEVLEAVLFEVTQSCPSAALPKCPPQVATMLMTTLTKLASCSQVRIARDSEAAWLDLLIPGVSLLLSKMTTLAQSPALSSVRCEGPSGAICMWATELVNLLKMPSIAQFMFTASMEVSQPHLHHDDSTALPLALRIVSQLVEKEARLLPGEGPVTRGAHAGSQIKSLVSSQAVAPVLREESRTPHGSLAPQRWSRLSWSPRGARISQARSPMTMLGCGEAPLIIAPALCGWM
ncbi:hypothetical protein MC885_013020, partial [Smutsia gigantea]